MWTRAQIWSWVGVVLLALAVAPGASASDLSTGAALPQPGLRGAASQGPRIGASVKSLQEMRWENVVRQRIDIGCGAAALATVLTYYFDFPATETEMFEPLLREALKGAGPNVREVGFNLRHIRNVAAQGGLAAAAFRVAEKDLDRIRIPGIVRITIHGYDHFAVFKEARGGHVYLADPAFGNTSYRLAAFSKVWSGIIMGFARRLGDRPLEHLLLVREEDERMIGPKEIMRLATPNLVPVGVTFPRSPFRLSTFNWVDPQLRGLRSVFPFIISNRIEF
jgi:predicted double-glycine peptidase